MTEVATPPAKFADKFESPEALEQGIREVRKTIGLPDLGDKKVFGAGGVYADVTAAESGYKELESIMGKIKQPTPPVTPPGETAEKKLEIKTAPGADADLAQVLEKAGIKGEELATEWIKSGKLSDDQYAKLKGQGLSKSVADTIMAGQQAIVQQHQRRQADAVAAAVKLTGGEQQLQNLLAFAATLPADRVEALNKRLGDPAQYDGALKELMYEHAQAFGAGNAKALIEASGGAPAAGSKPTTLKQYNELTAKAAKGDQGAADVIAAMDMADMNALS